jgi:hypothetical protein
MRRSILKVEGTIDAKGPACPPFFALSHLGLVSLSSQRPAAAPFA